MTREIRFRAWNSKGMIHSGATDLKFYIEARYGRPYTLERQQGDEWDMEPVNWQLMQYTGLKDKNGVEIYEGDLLKVSGWENEPSLQIRQVVWKDGAGFALEPNSAFDGIIFSDSSKDFEVLGNIYENPELLEKNHED